MNELKFYVNSIVQHLKISNREKMELASEFMDHLLLLKQEFIEQEYTEQESIRMAINEFGHSNDITPALQQSINPFYHWKEYTLWGMMILYCSYYLYENFLIFFYRNQMVYGHFLRDHFTFDFSLFYGSFTTTSIIGILLGSILKYGPLGFLWSHLFRKKFTFNLIVSLCFLQGLHLISFLIKFNMFYAYKFVFHLIGFAIGYLIWKFVRIIINYWIERKRSNKLDIDGLTFNKP
ncbi:hypothetical protein [Shimazuella kribbensis]|uniref:hypothetical protein n=1 Tax=Shimazuella kribbensis TaxID=139808 RepID=UPI00042422FC|nr:hypothetical protein [Shimazuella kribbensis]